MKIAFSPAIPRWLGCACLLPTLALSALHAADAPHEIIIPLDERLLTQLEATASYLAASERREPALRKDFTACAGDKKITGDTADALSASMAARHPLLAAALATQGWKAGDFYLAYGTLVSMPFSSELSRGGAPDTTTGVRRNVAFYDKHKARILALIGRLNPLVSGRQG